MTLIEYVGDSIKDQVSLTDLDVRLYKNYSGRCMFGNTCIGIVGSQADCNAFIIECAMEAAWTAREDNFDPFDIKRILSNYRVDNMGLEMIFYWPAITG